MNTIVTDNILLLDSFAAVVLDLDGVITQTAKSHAAAWKKMFDDYLAKHASQAKVFDIETDYRNYVDGKPRYDGVRSFLKARGIDLPYGNVSDPSDQQTICGLGNRKNELFVEKLRADGVKVYDSTIDLIRRLRNAGLRIAVVSSSRNCQAILEAAGIVDLFDVRVDGMELQKINLAGKPSPDMFIEASRRLNSEPQYCIGIEDAIAGVQAAQSAGFGCVIGVNRGDQAQALRDHGADMVVADLSDLRVVVTKGTTPAIRQLPSALDCMDEIVSGDDGKPVLFLDYDGTLTPIVSHPDDAILSDTMRVTLKQLAGLCEIAIISGRDLSDVRERVGIDGIWYAGSHGFDIAGPASERNQYQEGREYIPVLDAAEQSLRDRLALIPGCLVERKRFSIAIHFRQVSADKVPSIQKAVDQTKADFHELRMISGKKVFDLQPDIDWDKGKAMRWLMGSLDIDLDRFMPIYIGDDVTDEDAFRELANDGIGILIAKRDQSTQARYRLADPAEVQIFLQKLTDKLAGSQS